MCRKNVLLASVLFAFGGGLLVSLLAPGAFFRVLLAIAALVAGLILLQR